MRWTLVMVVVIAGCGSKDAPTGTGTGTGTGTEPERPVPEAVTVPAAAVLVAADGVLRVAPTRGSWKVPSDPVVIGSLDDLPVAVLKIVGDAGGPAAARAAEMTADLAEAAAYEGDDADDEDLAGAVDRFEVEIAFTYATAPGAEPPPVTPIVVVEPAASASAVVAVLDRVGGVLAVADAGTMKPGPVAFPWNEATWGGADLDEEERPAIDVVVGAAAIDLDEIRAEAKRLPAGGPEPVTDVLVTAEAKAEHLLAALAALAGAGAPRIGVAVSPWPTPATPAGR
jgi:hypothetical protein